MSLLLIRSQLFSWILVWVTWITFAQARAVHQGPQPSNYTANNKHLQTWWHDRGQKNLRTSVQPGDVRQSHLYSVQVASSAGKKKNVYYDSFVYAAIPRNGNGNIWKPGDLSSFAEQDDGISIEADIAMSMAWTQFLYSRDVTIKISRSYGFKVTAAMTTIRPTSLHYKVWDSDGNLYIAVPYSDQGTRFSVEFSDNLYDFHTSCTDPSNCTFVKTFAEDDIVVGKEPINSLMIFASPVPEKNTIPHLKKSSTLVVKPGLVTGLEKTDRSTIVFSPGIYWFTGVAHANLSSAVDWVYFAPGAYVKGAIQFNTRSSVIRVTGHGVLSGEQYVYQSNPAHNYTSYFDNENCLRMWRGTSISDTQQTFYLSGVTMSSPPFNSLDFDGDLDTISIHASDYKQVGAYFGQTDGITLYPNSSVHDVFYHSNDDTIKTYFSNVDVQRVTVWKGTTAPIIQFGWASRNLSNVTVNSVNVIHSRWNSNVSHPSLIGANQIYSYSESDTNTASLSNTISDVTFSNIRAEGISGNLFRIVPLSNIRNLTIENIYIHQYSGTTGVPESQLPMWYDSDGNSVSVKGFLVKNFQVGEEQVGFGKGNWEIGQAGNLNIAHELLQEGGVQVRV